MARPDSLAVYQRMRDFSRTPEPAGLAAGAEDAAQPDEPWSFVVQKHAARSLHYDFRLELDGTLKSWAVPKGPSLDPRDKRMAVAVEDHPLAYADFEGRIPPGQYGAGEVIVWDRGNWVPDGDARKALRAGKLKFRLEGSKLQGRWTLVRMKARDGDKQAAWLLMKEDDEHARPASEFSVVQAHPHSVLATPPAPRVVLPARLAPQLATPADEVPPGDDWCYEIKFDGYRLLTRIEGDEVRCFTRNGHDWSCKLPALVRACHALPTRSAWLDGEIVVLNENGMPDFQALQNAFERGSTAQLSYFVFDLPFCDGMDLRDWPLLQRRRKLAQVLTGVDTGPLHLSQLLEADPTMLLESARQNGLEGLIGKRKGSPYRSVRSGDWVKLKARLRHPFVVGGYTDPQGSRTGLGALLVGLQDAQGHLHYAGMVGSGFDEATLTRLAQQLHKLRVADSSFVDAPSRVGTGRKQAPHWVKPQLLADVSYAQWTPQRRIRHAVFHGLHGLRGLHGERAVPRKRAADAGITHAERVIDRASGLRKGDLVAYYTRVAPLLLPHLLQRPVALLRAPRGVGQPGFFQKHAEATALPHADLLDPALDPGHAPLLALQTGEALHSAAQMNMIELHTWNATVRAIAKPDRLVFDLDPGEGIEWAQVQEGAQLLHSFLDELRLQSFLKTSGGKGLHVLVPLKPRLGWAAVKAFSQAVVAHMAAVLPQRFVAKSGPRNRVRRIYIDYLRNGFGATTATAWSVRARPGLGISVPVAWDELAGLRSSAHWTVENFSSREAVANTPWQGYEAARQTLAPAMKLLGFKPPP